MGSQKVLACVAAVTLAAFLFSIIVITLGVAELIAIAMQFANDAVALFVPGGTQNPPSFYFQIYFNFPPLLPPKPLSTLDSKV